MVRNRLLPPRPQILLQPRVQFVNFAPAIFRTIYFPILGSLFLLIISLNLPLILEKTFQRDLELFEPNPDPELPSVL